MKSAYGFIRFDTEEEFKTKIENINTENFGSDQSNDDIEEVSEDENW